MIFSKLFRSKIFWVLVIIIVGVWILSINFEGSKPIVYGVSFSRFHADELGLDWKKVYLAALDDLKIRNFRFSAHWPLTEPAKGVFNFKEMDFQVQEAKKRNASVILAVGRRLPGWPECHTPSWAEKLTQDQRHEEILKYITTVINRYKGYSNIKYWQVENEPFLSFFSKEKCGELDNEFLKKEIELVRKLDPSRKIIVTDSGEFGTWYGAYKSGDVFGTSMYLYVWFKNLNLPFRYPITPGFFRIKHNLMNLIYGQKPSMVIELSAEPWLLQPIIETPMNVQMDRMGIDKFKNMIEFSKKTGFNEFYLWGMEWWYWLKNNGHPEFWSEAKKIYNY